MKLTAALLVVTTLIVSFTLVSSAAVGDRLMHTAFSYKAFPNSINDAKSSNDWVPASYTCVPGRGMAYEHVNGVASTTPVMVYFAQSSGLLSGFQLRRFHASSLTSAADKFWEAPSVDTNCDGRDCSDLFVSFRDPSTVCGNNGTSTPQGSFTLGDRVLVGSKRFPVPLNAADAKMAGWTEGNCIPHMGIHYAYTLGGNVGQSGKWNSTSLFPIMPMYDAQTGNINAILVANPHLANVFPLGWWEGPFINMLMCKNWCANSGCGFADTHVWTTMHFMFRDSNSISCAGAKCSLF